jgi:hypothetical protein
LGMHVFIYFLFCLCFLVRDQTNSILIAGIQEICNNLGVVKWKRNEYN